MLGHRRGRGLECDKMDTAALNLHFRSFPLKLVRHAENTQAILLITFSSTAGNADIRTGPEILLRNSKSADITASSTGCLLYAA
jgi:hypothetical protein